MPNNIETLRFIIFLTTFFFVAFWEVLLPKRTLNFAKPIRWYGNLGIITINSFILYLISPITLGALSIYCLENQLGLYNSFNFKPFLFTALISFLCLDLIVYFQHVIFHKIKFLWQFHKMHHTDLDIDLTTGVRFHPIEIVISLFIKSIVVLSLGVHPLTVLIFEAALNSIAMFNHGNVYIPRFLDKIFRYFVVTPDMHRVHHSIIRHETNRNFGFNIPYWDYLFGTYKDQPKKGHHGMEIGLKSFRKQKFLTIKWLIIIPFIKEYYD